MGLTIGSKRPESVYRSTFLTTTTAGAALAAGCSARGHRPQHETSHDGLTPQHLPLRMSHQATHAKVTKASAAIPPITPTSRLSDAASGVSPGVGAAEGDALLSSRVLLPMESSVTASGAGGAEVGEAGNTRNTTDAGRGAEHSDGVAAVRTLAAAEAKAADCETKARSKASDDNGDSNALKSSCTEAQSQVTRPCDAAG
jgi:hypothetical protein